MITPLLLPASPLAHSDFEISNGRSDKRSQSLRDDALQSHPAGMLEHEVAGDSLGGLKRRNSKILSNADASKRDRLA
jgi:hypothetical protein